MSLKIKNIHFDPFKLQMYTVGGLKGNAWELRHPPVPELSCSTHVIRKWAGTELTRVRPTPTPCKSYEQVTSQNRLAIVPNICKL